MINFQDQFQPNLECYQIYKYCNNTINQSSFIIYLFLMEFLIFIKIQNNVESSIRTNFQE